MAIYLTRFSQTLETLARLLGTDTGEARELLGTAVFDDAAAPSRERCRLQILSEIAHGPPCQVVFQVPESGEPTVKSPAGHTA
jgi:hypothetical protein